MAVNPSLDGLKDLLCPTTSGDYEVFKQRAFRTSGDFFFLKSVYMCTSCCEDFVLCAQCCVLYAATNCKPLCALEE